MAVLLSVACLPLLPAVAADESHWTARLSPNPISFGNRNSVTGIGAASAQLEGNTLTVQGFFEGLQGKATTVKIHHGPKAIPGPAILDLSLHLDGDGKQGKLSGELALTEEQRRALLAESLYIQLYSEAAEEGNLRGWLLLLSEDG